MLSEQLQNELDQEAKAEAKKLTGRVQIFRMGYEAGHYDGAEKYVEKWQEAEQKIKELRRWQKEAGSLLDPLLEWGQTQKDIPLGCSITVELLRRAKLFTEAERRPERYEKALNWVKQYALNCQNNRTIPNPLVIYSTIDKALAPKTTTDDTVNG